MKLCETLFETFTEISRRFQLPEISLHIWGAPAPDRANDILTHPADVLQSKV